MSSPSQIAANQANARLSTGPKSEEGKTKSSHNAKDEAAPLSEPKIQQLSALTGQTVLLPTDDVEAYQKHVARFEAEFKPVTDREKELTQNLADTQWRLNRIFSLEQGIYAAGHIEFASLYEKEDPSVRSALIEVKTFTTYQRQLNNLSLQNERLRRHYTKDTAELKELIRIREAQLKNEMAIAAENYNNAKAEGVTFDPRGIGFDFSFAHMVAQGHAVERKQAIQKGKFYTYRKQAA